MQSTPEPARDTPALGPESSREHRRSLFGLWFWALFLLFVVYPLSVGPAARLHQACPSAGPALEIVYYPLVVLIDEGNTAVVGPALVWYLQAVWGVK